MINHLLFIIILFFIVYKLKTGIKIFAYNKIKE
jgi:hypothetical protein